MKKIFILSLVCVFLLATTSGMAQGAGKIGDLNLRDMTALELTGHMGNGINLGNTMEAYGHRYPGIHEPPSTYETLWGQPITTSEMIMEMKKAGFDSIRIPVAWTNTMDYRNGDYTISPAYLERVAEIVNYALDADMFVIINDHWDGGWWGMFGSASEQTRKDAMDVFTSMWTQVGTYFKDYPHQLIFEVANEELGTRLNETSIAADSGYLSERETYQVTNRINQKFVDLIRGLGGNNSDRFLLVAGYNTDIERTMDDRFVMPKDTAQNKLLLSVHYYTPWNYCGTDSVNNWGTEQEYDIQNELLGKMTKFTDQGYGIIFGEYGVLPKSDGSLKKNIIDFLTNFHDNMELYGYVPMLWDTSSFFIRTELKIVDEDLANFFKERSLENRSALSANEVKERAKASMATALEIARQRDEEAGPVLGGSGEAVAWIMFDSGDYLTTYSVGDIYTPTAKTEGVIATDVVIEEEGTYTVALDFRGTEQGYANSVSFSAIGIYNGEILFPGYVIEIKKLLINGKPYNMRGKPYTTADDKACTRVNLYNEWVTSIPKDIRVLNDNFLPYVSATLLNKRNIDKIETIEVEFDYVKK
ncbi:MAG TPA: glycoside hydrolase family 5 protein [Natronincola sp.]|nr:glycoside hydrolase family 5 protein [Natronincola sp.]